MQRWWVNFINQLTATDSALKKWKIGQNRGLSEKGNISLRNGLDEKFSPHAWSTWNTQAQYPYVSDSSCDNFTPPQPDQMSSLAVDSLLINVPLHKAIDILCDFRSMDSSQYFGRPLAVINIQSEIPIWERFYWHIWLVYLTADIYRCIRRLCTKINGS